MNNICNPSLLGVVAIGIIAGASVYVVKYAIDNLVNTNTNIEVSIPTPAGSADLKLNCNK